MSIFIHNTGYNHTHTKSQITDFPTSLQNPNSITIKLNGGSTEGTNLFTYNGSSAKSLNITASSIGAATSGHSHSGYASSSHTHSQYYDSGQSRTANTVLAAPNGSAGSATFRKLVAADIPALSYLSTSGGTISGDLKVNKSVSAYGLEIYHTTTPFIDFHYKNDSSVDYTSRIIELEKGKININGTVCTDGASLWTKAITVDGSISVSQAGNFGTGVACGNESRFYINSYTDPLSGTTCAIKTTGIIAARGSIYSTASGSGAEAQVHVKNDTRDAYLCASGSGRAGIYDTKAGWIIFSENDCATTWVNGSTFTSNSLTVPSTLNAQGALNNTGGINSYAGIYLYESSRIKASNAATCSWITGAQPGASVLDCINTNTGTGICPGWRVRTEDGAWVGASYPQDSGFRIYFANASRLSSSTNGTDASFTFGSSGIMYAKSFSNTSDERRKDVVEKLDTTIPNRHKKFFMDIKPFTFKWNDKEEDTNVHYGVGAQTLYKSAKDLGFTDEELGFIHKGKELEQTSIPWSVSYLEFIPLNIAVTQEHDRRIEELEQRNEKLENELHELKEENEKNTGKINEMTEVINSLLAKLNLLEQKVNTIKK